MRTACVLLIGNEILSGRTQDQNLGYLGERLNHYGIRLLEARVIPDIESVIIETTREVSQKFDLVFTTGGIGPTHDDITSDAIAKAMGVQLERNEVAVKLLQEHYANSDTQLNNARLKMAEVPVGAKLIYNHVSAAPGFVIGNVHVLAGVPSIMRAMIDSLADALSGGPSMQSETIEAPLPEGDIADILSVAQEKFSQVEIGCYPKYAAGKLSSSLVMRSIDEDALKECLQHLNGALDAIIKAI